MLLIPRRDQHVHDERGVAMVVVVVLVVLCATVSMVVASSTMFGTAQTATDRSRLQALAAAEGGRDATLATVEAGHCEKKLYQATIGTTSATYKAYVYWWDGSLGKPPATPADSNKNCPPTSGGASGQTGYVGIASQGTADGVTKSVFAWYPYSIDKDPPPIVVTPSAPNKVAADGAILEGGATSMNIPSVVVHGDLVLGAGSFDCNGATTIDGDLIVKQGSIDMSNDCIVKGGVFAQGAIFIHNLTNKVGADVVSTTGTVQIEGAQVGGSVKAYGGVQLNNSVQVGGDVIAVGHDTSKFTGSSSSMKTIGGNVTIGGPLSDLNLVNVAGAITVSDTGATSVGAVGGTGSVTASSIRLAGSCVRKACSATPTPQEGVTGLTAPAFASPPQMGYPTWIEIPWRASDWTASGWTVSTASSSDCDYQNTAALVTAINSLTKPTVIDATACGTNGLKMYNVKFNLQTDVTFIANAFDAQSLTVNRSGSGSRTFNLIVPDPNSSDNAPTCPTSTTSKIYGATLGTGVEGIAYSPCTLAWGTATWAGQLMAGYPDPAGGNATITYKKEPIAGAIAVGGGTTVISPSPTATPTPAATPTPVLKDNAPTQQTEPQWTPST